MERFGANAGLARAIVALLVINAIVVALLLPFLGLEPLSSEEGPMENFQALLLIAAGAIFLFAAWRAGLRRPAASGQRSGSCRDLRGHRRSGSRYDNGPGSPGLPYLLPASLFGPQRSGQRPGTSSR